MDDVWGWFIGIILATLLVITLYFLFSEKG